MDINLWYHCNWNYEQVIGNLRNEDKPTIGDISKTLGISKCVIRSILRKLGHVKPGNHLEGVGKQPHGKTWFGNEWKKDQFATAIAIYKRANTNLSITKGRYSL